MQSANKLKGHVRCGRLQECIGSFPFQLVILHLNDPDHLMLGSKDGRRIRFHSISLWQRRLLTRLCCWIYSDHRMQPSERSGWIPETNSRHKKGKPQTQKRATKKKKEQKEIDNDIRTCFQGTDHQEGFSLYIASRWTVATRPHWKVQAIYALSEEKGTQR